MKRDQVFVRAKSPSGKWHSADVLDLDDLSFRIFVLEGMVKQRAVLSINPMMIEGDSLELVTVNEPLEDEE